MPRIEWAGSGLLRICGIACEPGFPCSWLPVMLVALFFLCGRPTPIYFSWINGEISHLQGNLERFELVFLLITIFCLSLSCVRFEGVVRLCDFGFHRRIFLVLVHFWCYSV